MDIYVLAALCGFAKTAITTKFWKQSATLAIKRSWKMLERDYIIKVREDGYQLSGVDVEAKYDSKEDLFDAVRKVLECIKRV